ncbi:MAG: panthothenate synthetase [Actinomycetota bacterium]|nr:panthothenate synthetase [Actinomycetota bacterium]
MKFIVEVAFPPEPFNTYVRKGTAGAKIGEVFGAIKPEVLYFTDNGVGRGALMIVEMDSASQLPHVTEPLMLNFNASVHYQVAIAPSELQSAGLEKYATT